MLKNIALCIAAVLLTAAPWLLPVLAPLSFFGFALLLTAERRINSRKQPYYNIRWAITAAVFAFGWYGIVLALSGFDLVSWLVYGATLTLALMLFRFIKTTLGNQRGYISLPFLWISAEALHFYQDWGAFPITLGSGFQNFTFFNAWTSLLGEFGTGLWIIALNIFIFLIVSGFQSHRQWKPVVGQSVLLVLVVVLAPVLFTPSPGEGQKVPTELREQEAATEAENLSDNDDPRLIPSRVNASISRTDRFVARMSFFLSIFLLLFTFVKAYMDKNPISKKP